jgi:hypothetical protein
VATPPTPPQPLAAGLFEPEREMGTVYLPSALLRADYGIVPFEHRHDDLAHLVAWAEDPEQVRALLVTAAGG